MLGAVSYVPFTAAGLNANTGATKISLTYDTGVIASGVEAIRFVFQDDGEAFGAIFGTVYQEIDVFGLPVGGWPSALTITAPQERVVFQRNDQNTAIIPIAGTVSDGLAFSSMKGRFTGPRNGPWVELTIDGNQFSGTLETPAGGWYAVEVQAFNGAELVDETSVRKIGVGEVFLTAGQSNAANYGSPAYTPLNDTVSAWTGGGWRHAYDPQPLADGTGGSPWSRLGDMLVDALEVPVGFMSVALGATAVDEWLPGTANYTRLATAIHAAGYHGVRTILWHQGEKDARLATSVAAYSSRLTTIINQSRIDSGWRIPWGIALVSFNPSATVNAMEAVRQGQFLILDTVSDTFEGPDTDPWIGATYRHDGIHFNAAGLQLHAEAWRDILLPYLPTYPMVLEDFEGDLSAWTIDEVGANYATLEGDPTDPNNKVLQLVAAEGTHGMSLPWVVDPNRASTLTFRMMFQGLTGDPTTINNNVTIGAADKDAGASQWADYYSILRMGGGTAIGYRDGSAYVDAAATSEELTWYNFKMDLDSASGTYDLYIDDVLIKAGAGFRSTDPDGIANVLILWKDDATSIMYIDDIVGYLR